MQATVHDEYASAAMVTGPHGRPVARRGLSVIAVVACLISLLMLIPLGFVAWAAMDTGWQRSVELIFRPRVFDLTVNTVLLVVLTVPLCLGLALTLAWLTERTNLPFARFWAWTAVAPLAIPAFVHSYAWITFAPDMEGLPAGILISVLAYFPFLYLPLSAALRQLDPALEDQAASLGNPPWKVWFRVVLPQLRLAICGGSLLIGLHLLAEYGLYVMIRFDTFTTAIVDQFQSTYNGYAANMLASVLVGLCLLLLALEFTFRGKARYARLGAGAARARRLVRLGRWTLPLLAIPALAMLMSIGVPLLTISEWIVAGGAQIWRLGEIGLALYQTVLLALFGGVLTTLAAIPMAWISVRSPGPLSRALEGANYITSALPGVVVALALVTVTVRVATPFYQTAATILLAYVIMFLPRALISLRASLAQAPVELEDAAASLGRSPWKSFWSVTIRLAAPGAAAGAALSSLGIMNELTATQMLAPNGTRTLAMAFWALSSEIDYAGAAPYAVIMILTSLPLTIILYNQSKRIAGR